MIDWRTFSRVTSSSWSQCFGPADTGASGPAIYWKSSRTQKFLERRVWRQTEGSGNQR